MHSKHDKSAYRGQTARLHSIGPWQNNFRSHVVRGMAPLRGGQPPRIMPLMDIIVGNMDGRDRFFRDALSHPTIRQPIHPTYTPSPPPPPNRPESHHGEPRYGEDLNTIPPSPPGQPIDFAYQPSMIDTASSPPLSTTTPPLLPPPSAAAPPTGYDHPTLEHAVEAICRWSNIFPPSQIQLMTSAAFPMIDRALICAITKGIARAGGFPTVPPQWQETYESASSSAAPAPFSPYTAVPPSLADGDLINIILDLQEQQKLTLPSVIAVENPDTPLSDERMALSPSGKQ